MVDPAASNGGSAAAGKAMLTKHIAVQRSNRVPTLYWWSLPLRLRDAATLYAGELAGASAVVHPAGALGAAAAALGAEPWPGDTAHVTNVPALLQARDDGRVGPCTIAVFPSTVRLDELQPRMTHFHDDLEQLGYTIALIPEGDGGGRHRFCCRVPGQVIVALEHLAHGRSFGGNPGQVEMALLAGLQLRPKQVAQLRLVLQGGGVQLAGDGARGRQRITYLEANKGYTGKYEDLSWREVARERQGEAWRRFPLGVVMPLGLPFFIAMFWIHNLMTRRGARDAVASEAPSAVRAAVPGTPVPRPTP